MDRKSSCWWVSEVAQSCPALCDPVDCSLPGFSIHRILQARRLEWITISFSRGIFPTQGSNLGLPLWRQTLYLLSHQGAIQIQLIYQCYSIGEKMNRKKTFQWKFLILCLPCFVFFFEFFFFFSHFPEWFSIAEVVFYLWILWIIEITKTSKYCTSSVTFSLCFMKFYLTHLVSSSTSVLTLICSFIIDETT